MAATLTVVEGINYFFLFFSMYGTGMLDRCMIEEMIRRTSLPIDLVQNSALELLIPKR